MYKLTIINDESDFGFIIFQTNSVQSVLEKIRQELKKDVGCGTDKSQSDLNIVNEFFNSEKDRIEFDYSGSCKYTIVKR